MMLCSRWQICPFNFESASSACWHRVWRMIEFVVSSVIFVRRKSVVGFSCSSCVCIWVWRVTLLGFSSLFSMVRSAFSLSSLSS